MVSIKGNAHKARKVASNRASVVLVRVVYLVVPKELKEQNLSGMREFHVPLKIITADAQAIVNAVIMKVQIVVRQVDRVISLRLHVTLLFHLLMWIPIRRLAKTN